MQRLQQTLTAGTLPYPGRFRVAAAAGKLARPFSDCCRTSCGQCWRCCRMSSRRRRRCRPSIPAEGARRYRVALLVGCVQQALAPEINWATLRVLAKNGVEVVIPADQGCCGALLIHTGDHEQARRLARRNLRTFPKDVDVILTNAAGCGSGMHEYRWLFSGQPDFDVADEFAGRALDVSQFPGEH